MGGGSLSFGVLHGNPRWSAPDLELRELRAESIGLALLALAGCSLSSVPPASAERSVAKAIVGFCAGGVHVGEPVRPAVSLVDPIHQSSILGLKLEETARWIDLEGTPSNRTPTAIVAASVLAFDTPFRVTCLLNSREPMIIADDGYLTVHNSSDAKLNIEFSPMGIH